MSVKNNEEKIVRRTVVYENLEDTAKYLEEMAASGWMLKEISAGSKFIFTKCEPADLRFAAEIFVNGSMFDTHVIDTNLEYIEYCEKAGWKFVCSSADIDIFVTDRDDAPEIESDPELKLRAIMKANRYKKVGGPLIMLAMGAYNLGYSLTVNLNEVECSFLSFSGLLLWTMAMILYIGILGSYLIWVVKAKAAAAQGEKLPVRKTISYTLCKAAYVIFGILHSAFAIYIGSVYQEKMMYVIPAIWLVCILISLAGSKVTAFAEKTKVGRDEHRALIMVILPLCTVSVLTIMILVFIWRFGSEEVEGYGVGKEDLQAFAGQMTEEKVDANRTHWGHFLVCIDSYSLDKNADSEEDVTSLCSIDVYNTKVASIHDRLLSDMKDGKFYRMLSVRFQYDKTAESSTLENGVNVYQYEDADPDSGDKEYVYLIYDEEVIVFARCESELSGEQMNLIRETFM